MFSCLGILLLVAIWGVYFEPQQLVSRQVKRNSWPGSDLKIVFFSDLHAGAPYIDRPYIEGLVAAINAESPDLVLIGGDIVTTQAIGGTTMIPSDVALLLGKLSAPLGIFAVLGNHDWWYGGAEVASALQAQGIEILDNKAKLIERSDQSKFWLIGIGDDFTDHSVPQEAFRAANRAWPRIVFMHDPGSILQIREPFYAAFAGHMHGGQIYLPGAGPIVTFSRAPRHWAGGHWVESLYGSLMVSHGIGTSILPIRINAPPEYVVAQLQSAPLPAHMTQRHLMRSSLNTHL